MDTPERAHDRDNDGSLDATDRHLSVPLNRR
jgi:hypothetical protein